MSDNIPFEIQMEIIKKVSDVKSLIQFRSVSKPWKSFIDSSDFIKGYGARDTQPHSFIVSYATDFGDGSRHICLVDDNIETLQVQKFAPSVMSPLLKQCCVFGVVGTCHGLVCLYCYNKDIHREMLVIWNPSIRKSFGIGIAHNNPTVYGFGVCPVTSDPTVVKILCPVNKPWHVEVFTLSSGVWNVIPSGNLPRQSIQLNMPSTQVVTNSFIYWGASEKTFMDDGRSTINHMIVSFDLVSKKFKVVDLPYGLKNDMRSVCKWVSVCKLKESLVVFGFDLNASRGGCCGLWVMEHDSSFRKLFSIHAPFYRILGFSKNDETVFATARKHGMFVTLDAYDPSSQQIKNLGINGVRGSFFMESYKQSLLLLDHSESLIYSDDIYSDDD